MQKQKRTPSISIHIHDFIRRKWRYIVPLLTILIVMLTFLVQRQIRYDTLVYSVSTYNDGQSSVSLMSYNPNTHKETTILTVGASLFRFSVSRDGRLAYSFGDYRNIEIHIRDNLSPDTLSINITQNLDRFNYAEVMGWSPDGRYLVFRVHYADASSRIYVWNGADIIDITPTDIVDSIVFTFYSDLSWSPDGKLSFTAYYNDPINFLVTTEIYLWDGDTIINLSQNPSGSDGHASWNNIGELALLSEKNGKFHILVWDGISLKNDLPDVDSFANIAPDIIQNNSVPRWTSDNQLAFNAGTQIYIWDGNTATNITSNPPNFLNLDPQWSTNGNWAFTSIGRFQTSLVVQDKQNNVLLTTLGQSAIWSSDGDLLFCTSDGGWRLNLWNSKEVINITQQAANAVGAQWQSGASVYCSSG